jgi:hypothetical protein
VRYRGFSFHNVFRFYVSVIDVGGRLEITIIGAGAGPRFSRGMPYPENT